MDNTLLYGLNSYFYFSKIIWPCGKIKLKNLEWLRYLIATEIIVWELAKKIIKLYYA
jgi:hypothetical protein